MSTPSSARRAPSSMRTPNFRRFVLGQAVSQVGFFMQTVALALLVLDLTDSAVLLGLVGSLQFLPVLVLGLWAGVMSDRVDRRRLMLATQSAMMVLSATLGVIVVIGWATIGVVVVLTALSGIVWAVDQPARRSVVNDLVDDALLPSAVGLSTAAGNTAQIVGPAIAGLVIATVGIGWCFMVNALSYLAVIGALASMDRSAMRQAATCAA